jgi:hypothetical protein
MTVFAGLVAEEPNINLQCSAVCPFEICAMRGKIIFECFKGRYLE